MRQSDARKGCLLVVMLGCAVAVPGCAGGLKRAILLSTGRGDYTAALARLERAGVGVTVSDKARPDQLEARTVYQEAVEKHFLGKSNDVAQVGKVRAALEVAEKAWRVCPWSAKLEAAADARSWPHWMRLPLRHNYRCMTPHRSRPFDRCCSTASPSAR